MRAAVKAIQRRDLGGFIKDDFTKFNEDVAALNKDFPGWQSARDVIKNPALWHELQAVKNSVFVYDHHIGFYARGSRRKTPL